MKAIVAGFGLILIGLIMFCGSLAGFIWLEVPADTQDWAAICGVALAVGGVVAFCLGGLLVISEFMEV